MLAPFHINLVLLINNDALLVHISTKAYDLLSS